MTDEKKKVSPQDYYSGFPEAPASDTCKWVDAGGFEHMTTIRAWSVAGMSTQIAEFYADVTTAGGKPAGQFPTAAPPRTDPAAKAAAEAGNPALAEQLASDAIAVPDASNGKAWITFDATTVNVLPQPDGRTTLEFYGAGQKYPGVKVNKWPVENCSGLMKHVTSEDMAKAARYDLHCRVYYTEGKEGKTTEGKVFHFKDVGHVRPL